MNTNRLANVFGQNPSELLNTKKFNLTQLDYL